MLHWLGALVFLSTLGFILIVLFITYTCIKKEMCWCQDLKKPADSDDEPLMTENYDDSVGPLYDKFLVNEQATDTEFNFMLTRPTLQMNKSIPSASPLTSDAELERNQEKEKKRKRKKRVTLSDLSGIKTSSDDPNDDTLTSSQFQRAGNRTTVRDFSQTSTSEDEDRPSLVKIDKLLDNIHQKISLLYSKNEGTLMLTINEMTGVPTKTHGGYNLVRVSATLMPEKKYKMKTVWHVVTGDDVILFGDSFKISSLTRHTLAASSFRFRLYGRKGSHREVCVGEMVVEMAEVSERIAGYVTWGKYERKMV